MRVQQVRVGPSRAPASNIAARIRPSNLHDQRDQFHGQYDEPRRSGRISERTIGLLAAAAGMSAFAVVASGVIGGAVVALALNWAPNNGAPIGSSAAPSAVSSGSRAAAGPATLASPLAGRETLGPADRSSFGAAQVAVEPPGASSNPPGGMLAAVAAYAERMGGTEASTAPVSGTSWGSPGPGAGPTGAGPGTAATATAMNPDDGLRALLDDLGAPTEAAADPTVAAMLASLDEHAKAPNQPVTRAPESTWTQAPKAPPAPGFLQNVRTAGSEMIASLTGSSEPVRPPPSLGPSLGPSLAPSLAPALTSASTPSASGPIEADDGLSLPDRVAARAQFSTADQAAMALLLDIERSVAARETGTPTALGSSASMTPVSMTPAAAPVPPRTAQPPAPASGGFLDTLSSMGSQVVSMVTGGTTPTPATPALPRTASVPVQSVPVQSVPVQSVPVLPALAFDAAPVDLLADDDGLRDVRVTGADRTGGFQSERSAENDPALAMLAELDGPVISRAPQAPPAASQAAAPAKGDGWLETLVAAGSSVGSSVGSTLSSLVPGGSPAKTPPPLVAPATVASARPSVGGADPVAALLADIEQGRVAPAAGSPGSSSSWAAPAPAVAAADDSWFESVVSAGNQVVAALTGTPGSSSARPTTSEGRPGVDLLAEDDSLSLRTASSADRTGGFQGRAETDDIALRLLAEVEATGPSLASVLIPHSNDDEWTTPIVSVGSAQRPSTAAPATRAPVVAPIAPDVDPGWLDSVTNKVTALIGEATGTSAARTAAVAPGRMAPGTAPTARPATDLLAGDDGLRTLAPVRVATRDEGWVEPAGADDKVLAMLAELDGPATPRPTPQPAARPVASVASGSAKPSDRSWLESMRAVGNEVASYMTGTPSAPTPVSAPSLASVLAPSPGAASAARPATAAAPKPVASNADLLRGEDGLSSLVSDLGDRRPSQNDPAVAMLRELDAPTRPASVGFGSSDAPPFAPTARTMEVSPGPVATSAARPAPPTFASQPRPAAPPACGEGELCGDSSLTAWRDSLVESVDLLADDEGYLFLGTGALQSGVQLELDDLFNIPGQETSLLIDDGGIDELGYLVLVTTDISGVPVSIDGRMIGAAPLVAQVSPGLHSVRLFSGSAPTDFQLEAQKDPDEWCFEAKGRSFKQVRCL